MKKTVRIFDTTLRDGEQAPGCSMNISDKVRVARQLEKLGVDVIEAGFAIASPGDFESVQAVAAAVEKPIVASLARAVKADIDRAWEAVKGAKKPMIHTFIATSDIHMEHKLKMTREQVLTRTAEMVAYAKSLSGYVEFSAEDASRSDLSFLCQVLETAVENGADVLNIPDTVGYSTPSEMAALIAHIKKNVKGVENVIISVHCHNDLGLAVANSLASVAEGASQVECTINGLGERAGNASLEEIVMALTTRKDLFQAKHNINTQQIYPTSRMVSSTTGQPVQVNKAIVGDNAFAHEAGIHQHGVLANRMTYEIMTPESVGISGNKMVLGKHSGKHALADRLSNMGYHLGKETLSSVFDEFKKLCDTKKNVDDRDLEALVSEATHTESQFYRLEQFETTSGNMIDSSAEVALSLDGKTKSDKATGDGPVDAAFKAIEQISGKAFKLQTYRINAVTEGEDAMGMVDVTMEIDGQDYKGRGVSTDIIESSIRACLDALNRAK
ncbi:MAG: 2-isopropylmalate synthase [Eubacteriales bacterium]